MNERDVRLTYRFLHHETETEIRLIDPRGKLPPTSMFVHNEDEFLGICKTYDGMLNIYVGINERFLNGTTAKDVRSVNVLVFDIDSIHPKDFPSTPDETKAALAVAKDMMAYLKKEGKESYLAMSGNGWQIWCSIRITLDEKIRDNVGKMLKELQRGFVKQFSNHIAKVDNIGDLARVVKVIGTTALKANQSEDRPFRESFWYTPPYRIEPQVTWGMRLRSLAMSTDWVAVEEKDLEKVQLRIDEVGEYLNRFSIKMKDLFEGKWRDYKYRSRSEAEYALVCGMANVGIPMEAAFTLMEDCKIGKWKEKSYPYKKSTINKAYEFVKENAEATPK